MELQIQVITVEYRDATPHSNWEDANLGDFSDFTTRWDSAHLAQLQFDWDMTLNVTTDAEGNDFLLLKTIKLLDWVQDLHHTHRNIIQEVNNIFFS